MRKRIVVGIGAGAVVTAIVGLGIVTPAAAMRLSPETTVGYLADISARSEEGAGRTPLMCPPANLDHRADYREQPGGPSSLCPGDLPADPESQCQSVYQPCLSHAVVVPPIPNPRPPSPDDKLDRDILDLAVGALCIVLVGASVAGRVGLDRHHAHTS